ncbi:MAG: hypothetical protein ACTHMG_16565, partial [Sphingomonas sp.]
VSAQISKTGERSILVGQPCDSQEEERRRRVDALTKHMLALDGMRAQLQRFLEQRGHYTDDRPSDPAESTAALRDFIMAGYRVFLRPDGRLGTSTDVPLEWLDAEQARAEQIEGAARRFARVRRRWRNQAQIKRAVSMLGTASSNGFIVLEAKGR